MFLECTNYKSNYIFELSLNNYHHLVASLFGRVVMKFKTPLFKGAEATLKEIDGENLKISILVMEGMNWTLG